MANLADPAAAVIAYLLAQPGISDLVGTRAFSPDIPPEFSAIMPTAVITVKIISGGGVGAHYRSDFRPRIEVRTYGIDDLEAYQLAQHVYDALQTLGENGLEIRANTALQSAVCTSPPGVGLEKIGTNGWRHYSSLWLIATDYLPVSA
jgi:hypothetical protein